MKPYHVVKLLCVLEENLLAVCNAEVNLEKFGKTSKTDEIITIPYTGGLPQLMVKGHFNHDVDTHEFSQFFLTDIADEDGIFIK